MNYYERHLGDSARETGRLTMLQCGAYSRLSDHYYGTEAPIPADEVYQIAAAQSKADRDAVDAVLRKLFQRDGDAWRHPGIDERIAKARRRITAAAENGRKGGRPPNPGGNPKGTQGKPTGFPLGSDPDNPTRTERESQPGPSEKLTNHQSPEELGKGEASPGESGTRAATDDGDRAAVPEGSRMERIPPGVPETAWRLFVQHHAAKRAWSLPRAQLTEGHCTQLLAEGMSRDDLAAVLAFAIVRNHGDLLDSAREWRKAEAAKKAEQTDGRPIGPKQLQGFNALDEIAHECEQQHFADREGGGAGLVRRDHESRPAAITSFEP